MYSGNYWCPSQKINGCLLCRIVFVEVWKEWFCLVRKEHKNFFSIFLTIAMPKSPMFRNAYVLSLISHSMVRANLIRSEQLVDKYYQSINVDIYLTLIGMREGTFHSPVFFGSDFVSWVFIKNFKTFLEVKIDIDRVNLTPCQAHSVL